MCKSKGYHKLSFWLVVVVMLLVNASVKSYAVGTVESYSLPSIYNQSVIFTLKAGTTTVPVVSYVEQYDYANFSFSGSITIEITVNEMITSYSISPLAKGINGYINGNKLTFTLSESTYVIVEINNLKRLVISADPLEVNVPASSGSGIYNITMAPYHADPSGTGMSTSAIQSAINNAHNAGGGTVYVPAGVYKCANLYLKSNVTLYLAGGSVIVGTGNKSDYVTDFHKSSLGKDGTYFIRTTTGSSNITVRGRGTIDGRGISMRVNSNFLNNLLVPMQTSHFTFEGITLRDGGFWAFMPVRSDNVSIKNYKGFQSLDYLEADAIDINECQNVTIQHAVAISDDDTYSTKTWWQYGMSENWPGSVEVNDTITFDDCLAWSECVAFKLGQGTGQLQKNIIFKNSYVYECSRALVVDHSYEYGNVQNITFYNMDIEKVNHNQFGNYWFRVSSSSQGPVNNVKFQNINVRQVGSQSSIIRGFDEIGSVDGLLFSNINIKGKIASNLSDMKAAQGNYTSNIVVVNNSNILFHDHFEDNSLASWDIHSGGWNIGTNDSKVLAQTSFTPSIISSGEGWSDYTYEAVVKLQILNANAGILFRMQDADNYYMYRVNGSTNEIELFKCINGSLSKLWGAPFDVQVNEWIMLKTEMDGNQIKGYVDGKLMTNWTNPLNELTYGKVGFRTTSQYAVFDDALVLQH